MADNADTQVSEMPAQVVENQEPEAGSAPSNGEEQTAGEDVQVNVNGEQGDASSEAKDETKAEDDKQPQVEGGLINATEDNELKMFVGGLSWDTETFGLREYFKKFGEVKDCTIKKDSKTERSRGFGFVLFGDKDSVEKVLAQKEHYLDGRKIDPKKAQAIRKDGKLFVGGISTDTDNDKVKAYFEAFGEIEAFERPTDKSTGKNRGFCFITFKKDGIIRECCSKKDHELDGQKIDVKEAQNQNERNSNRNFMGRGGFMHNRGGWSGPPSYNSGYGYVGGYDYSGGYAGGYGGGFGGYGNYGGFAHGGYGGSGGKTTKGRGDSARSGGGWATTRTHSGHTNNNWHGSNNRGRFHGAYQNYHDY